MENTLLKDIVTTCFKIEKNALELYKIFHERETDSDLKSFWREMCDRKKDHTVIWKKIQGLASDNLIPEVFDSPQKTKNYLSNTLNKADDIFKRINNYQRTSDPFFIAYQLEHYMLKPEFKRLFTFLDRYPQMLNMRNMYQKHIKKFLVAMKKYGTSSLEMELLAKTIDTLLDENEKLAIQAVLDDLTGVYSRKGFFDTIQPLLLIAQRNQDNIGIVMIDIDHFKNINDTFGHYSGDKVLKSVSQIIKKNIRKSDLFGRLGGDEFILYIPSIDSTNLKYLTEKLRVSVSQETKNNIPVTISIGAYHKKIEKNIKSELHFIMKKADELLYKAKKTGRNKTFLYQKIAGDHFNSEKDIANLTI